MENEKVKTSRASQTRTKAEAPKTWTPPSSLDAPPAPDGFRHRWIRVEVLGFDDTKNMSARLNKHNRRILESKQGNEAKTCNCHKSQKKNFPLKGGCQAGPIVYKAEIK